MRQDVRHRLTGPALIGLGLGAMVIAGLVALGNGSATEGRPQSTVTATPTATPTPARTATPSPSSMPTQAPTPSATGEPTQAPSLAPPPPPPAGRPSWSGDLLRSPLSRGDISRPVVHLTFDDGWGYTNEILNVLLSKGVRATACFNGSYIDAHRDVVARWAATGMGFCNHSYSHSDLSQMPGHRSGGTITWEEELQTIEELYDDAREERPLTELGASSVEGELTATEAALQQAAAGAVMQPFFRPPYGAHNVTVREVAASRGYRTIMWSLDPQDWRPGLNPATLAGEVVNRAGNGEIILLHFGRWSTVEALPAIIDGLHARGFILEGLEYLPNGQ